MRAILPSLPWVALSLATFLPGQVSWERVERIENRGGHGMAPDYAGGGILLFGGLDGGFRGGTWRFDGVEWQRLAPATAPSPRHSFAMASDIGRRRIVQFGGIAAVVQNETWEWDGATWTQRNPANAPPPRFGHAGAYDAARQRFIVFGGYDGTLHLGDTWEWDGTTWTQQTPVNAPPARSWHSMAYDPLRGRIVLFGGFDGAVHLADTWEWDGSNWTPRFPSFAPSARGNSSMTYDPLQGRIVLFGGMDPVRSFGDTWEWDGAVWMQVASTGPADRHAAAISAVPGGSRIVLFGGQNFVEGYFGDTWEWSGSAWSRRQASWPAGRFEHAMAFDPSRRALLLFGGCFTLSDTWAWNGERWRRLQPQTAPPGRNAHAMATDSRRGRVVLFGGRNACSGSTPAVMLGDTWTWDGSTWRDVTPAVSPSPRAWHAMVEDTARGVVVLYGGHNGLRYLDDTWEWDGSRWRRIRPASGSPPPRRFHALAYDAARARTVLFGGWSPSSSRPLFDDTWEWNGIDWTMRSPARIPPARAQHAMAYDPTRQRIVMYGGHPPGSGVLLAYDDTWEWDGTDWSLRLNGSLPGPRSSVALGYDPKSERVLLFGGSSSSATFLYGAVDPASVTVFGNGCPGTAGVPALAPREGSRPWLGDTLDLALAGLPASGPAAVLLGSSNRTWAGVPLPLELGPFGMPGCRLAVSPDVFLPLVNAGGTAALDLPIPNAPRLVGTGFYAQGFAFDPPANAFGVTASNGCFALVGGR